MGFTRSKELVDLQGLTLDESSKILLDAILTKVNEVLGAAFDQIASATQTNQDTANVLTKLAHVLIENEIRIDGKLAQCAQFENEKLIFADKEEAFRLERQAWLANKDPSQSVFSAEKVLKMFEDAQEIQKQNLLANDALRIKEDEVERKRLAQEREAEHQQESWLQKQKLADQHIADAENDKAIAKAIREQLEEKKRLLEAA